MDRDPLAVFICISALLFLIHAPRLLPRLAPARIPPPATTSPPTTAPPPPLCNLSVPLRREDVRWDYENATDSFRLRIEGCVIPELSLSDARRCLQNEFILLMGDSLTRYRYLSLAYYLATGNWSRAPAPEVTAEYEWPSWPVFYNGTNTLLGAGMERCDCYRTAPLTAALDCITENRLYTGHGVRVGYVQVFSDDRPPHGHFNACAPGHCDSPAEWIFPLVCGAAEGCVNVFEGLRRVFPWRPSRIFVNQGFWVPTTTRSSAWFRELMGSAAQAADQVYWSTTTTPRPPVEVFNETTVKQWAAHYKWRVFDQQALTWPIAQRTPFPGWDNLHYHPWVYRELNKAMLAHICLGK